MLDGNNLDFVKNTANDILDEPKLGVVVEVYEHLVEDDNSNFECDILIDGGKFEERAVPYNGSHANQISPPKVGDTVLVLHLEGENTKPLLMDAGYTNTDRAPLARAGMYRDVYDSGSSPAGDGNIMVTGYTQYDDNPAKIKKSKLSPERSWFQISKSEPTPDPTDPSEAPMSVEMYDAPETDESHIQLVGNNIDGDDSKSISTKLDMKSGTITSTATNETSQVTTEISQDVKNDILSLVADDGSSEYRIDFDASDPSITIKNSDDNTGFKLDFSSGSFTILGSDGHGIESDGNGNFTWHYESINFSEGTTTSL